MPNLIFSTLSEQTREPVKLMIFSCLELSMNKPCFLLKIILQLCTGFISKFQFLLQTIDFIGEQVVLILELDGV